VSIAKDVAVDVRFLRERDVTWVEVGAAVLLNRGVQALCLYRAAHGLRRRRVPCLPGLLTRWSQVLYGIDIDPAAEIGPGAVIYHGVGLVIGKAARVGPGAVFYQGVTLGNRASGRVQSSVVDGMPVLGKDVVLGAGAKVLGPIEIGDRVVIGANSVVIQSIPADHLAVGVPARAVPQDRRHPVGPTITSAELGRDPRQ
jgi:serine O-acetyltransferase